VDEVPTRHLPLTVEKKFRKLPKVRVLAESSINLQPCLDEQLKIQNKEVQTDVVGVPCAFYRKYE
jgi:hypothetical protein